MKRIIWCSAIVCATLLGITIASHAQEKGKENAQISKQREQISYYCPMHPEVVSDKPGKCPKCGMNLEKKTSVKPGNEEQVVYYCPMHSEVTSTKPGKCPKCGMNLVYDLVEEKKESTGSKVKSEMKMDSMCAEMCMMMMNDPAMMKMMHPPKADMMGGMGDMKDLEEKPDDAMRMKAMSVRTLDESSLRPSEEKMKSCCGMNK